MSTIMLLLPGFIPIKAFATENNGMRYWTVEDLIKMNAEKEAEKDNLCHGDLTCENEFYENLRSLDSTENNVLEMFNSYRFIISRINPSEESVHILFHDTDEMERKFGNTTRDVLSELHLVWLDPSLPDPRTDFSWVENGHPAFVDQIHENNLDNTTHLLLTKSISKDGQDWIAPNKEVKFFTNSSELSSDSTGIIHYAGLIGTWQPYGAFEYGECLNSPDYHKGMECRYVFYENYERGYLPFEIKTSTPKENETRTAKTSNTEASTTNTTTTETPTTIGTSVTTFSSPTTVIATKTPEDQKTEGISTSIIGVPENTSENHTKSPLNTVEVPLAAGPEEEPEFPWWLIIFGFSGIFLIIWWFLPVKRRSKED